MFSSILKKEIGYDGEIIYLNHHLSHASGTFFCSHYQKSAILTIDGVGEKASTTRGIGYNNNIEIKYQINFPNSLGLLYSTFTYYLGFEVNEGEYKMMGLAPYGKDLYKDLILEEIVFLNKDGSYKLNMQYFSFQFGRKMFNRKFERLFGKKTRNKNDKIEQFHKDIACSIQRVIEIILLKIVNNIYENTNLDNLCISGGVGLNCVANYHILKNSKFKNIYVQSSPGDSGASIGVCYYIYYSILNNKRQIAFDNIYLGEDFEDFYIKKQLEDFSDKVNYQKMQEKDLLKKVANLIYKNKIIGWFQGRTEFGPRALGNRSILGNPLNKDNWQKINLKIKFRESFRPFAPSIIEEKLGDFYDLDGEFPYMLFIAKVKNKNLFPAVTHVDGSSRIQTISKKQNIKYYNLIKEFEKISGFPILINTSFNLGGYPIVNSPLDAINTFLKCEMDYLVLGNYFITKK